MKSYIYWIGQNVDKQQKIKGTGTEELAFLNRPASPGNGKVIYASTCARCHGPNGQGVWEGDSINYSYPPLWGANSFNVSAGMFRLGKLAGFIKNNMPFGATYKNP